MAYLVSLCISKPGAFATSSSPISQSSYKAGAKREKPSPLPQVEDERPDLGGADEAGVGAAALGAQVSLQLGHGFGDGADSLRAPALGAGA